MHVWARCRLGAPSSSTPRPAPLPTVDPALPSPSRSTRIYFCTSVGAPSPALPAGVRSIVREQTELLARVDGLMPDVGVRSCVGEMIK